MNWPNSAKKSWWSRHESLGVIGVLFLGQLVSLFTALIGLTSSLIAKQGVDAPLTQSMFAYASLALIYGSILLYRHQKPLVSWYWYLLLAVADVHGTYLITQAYQYTTITSITLLYCCTIPWVIILTWFFLGTRYSLWQLSGSRHILGDILVILATLFYGISNVGVEFCAKRKDRVEVLCMIGVFGFLVTIVEASVTELKTLESVKWSSDIVLCFVGFVVSSFMFYTTTPFVLKLGGATMFNLSSLTTNMWAVMFQVFIYHGKVSWLYFLSFAIIVVGLIIYSTIGKGSLLASVTTDENQNTKYEVLINESTASANESND
ncbi:putative solute carrier family 35 member SLC35F1/F2/F6 [Lupinus albus]|uniref:Putative solute carrier family 35 member SLC35F1/F2/F6 n=1 Tax=Lupinus albus TaxID=3870 RepID=A0A6A4NJB0_LUPAL|nr:putative solute carrier family 35 member SLC35F1/F2/F6 [Lupinus albus]